MRFEEGVIRKEGGATRYNLNPIGPVIILAGFDFWPDAAGPNDEILCIFDGVNAALLKGPSIAVTLASGFQPMTIPQFVEGGAESLGRPKKLFFFAGNSPTLVLKGHDTVATTMGGTPLAPPSSPAGLLLPIGGGGMPGNVDNGGHHYVTTFVTPDGETTPSLQSDPVWVADKTVQGLIKVYNIQLGPDGTTARKLYRSKADTASPLFLLATIQGNFQNEYIDNTADASLPATQPPTTNTTNGRPVEWAGNNWPTCGANHSGRLWAAGANNDPHRVYYSTPADHENFRSTNAGSLPIYPGEGQFISGMLSFGDKLVIWKYPNGIYTIDTHSVLPSEWRVDRVSSTYGGLNAQTQCLIENDVLFLAPTGEIQLLSAVLEFTNLGGQSLSRALQIDPWIRQHVNTASLRSACLVYYARKREVHIALSQIGAGYLNNLRLVIDFNRADRPRLRVSTRDICHSLWVAVGEIFGKRQPWLLSGDPNGGVWILDLDSTDKQGAGYLSRYRTMWTDLSFVDPSLGTKAKNAHFLELEMNPTGRWPIMVKVWWDGRLQDSLQVTGAQPGGYALGSWTLGASALLGNSAVLTERLRLTGGGRRVSLEVSNDQPGQDFSIAHAYLSFGVADERVR